MRVDGQSVTLLSEKISILDIEDAEGFVAATIVRSKIRCSQHEHEELLTEGLAILFDLARRFEPQREGYERPGRFSGFAAQFLPRKLGDAWHKLHPEHRYVTGEDGKRRWVFFEAPSSLDALLQAEGDRGRGGHSAELAIRPANTWAPPEPVASAR